MATLTSSYQYLGRSDVMKSTDGKTSYYLLLYGKTSANTTTGVHTVTIKSKLASTIKSSYYLYKQEYNGKIAGTTAFSGTSNPDDAWEVLSFTDGGVTYKVSTELGEGSVNVDCSNGLSKDITLSCYYKFKSTNAATYTPSTNAEATVSVTVTLPAIIRGATLNSASNFSDGENPTITYMCPAGQNFTVQAGIYDATGYIPYVAYRNISILATRYTFDLTDDERNTLIAACGDSNSIEVKFYIKTVINNNGGTFLSNPISKTFSITDALPIITASVIDVNEKTVALTGDNKKLIKYFSNAQATMSAEAQKGASIDESLYIIRNGNNTGYGTSHTFENVENNVFTFSAEDSRGNIGKETITPDMVEYIKPTCYIRSNKPDGEGKITVECLGEYFNGSFGAESNSLTVQCRYGTTSGYYSSGWIDMDVTTGNNNFFASVLIDLEEVYEQAYKKTFYFQTRATDKLTYADSTEYKTKSLPVFHWGENDFVFETPVEIKGDLRLKGEENFGNTLRFGDKDYCYISEPEDDVMTIKASRINLEANGVYVYGYPIPVIESGVWTPSLSNTTVVASYEKQYGWYSKIGQVVSVGFIIKAKCYAGGDTFSISISGLPFVPMYSTAGGGMCSNAKVSAGFNFQCFVAETTGLITTRVQSCNHTTAGNLSTSASGCFYPTGITAGSTGDLTLSGTITFIANS